MLGREPSGGRRSEVDEGTAGRMEVRGIVPRAFEVLVVGVVYRMRAGCIYNCPPNAPSYDGAPQNTAQEGLADGKMKIHFIELSGDALEDVASP